MKSVIFCFVIWKVLCYNITRQTSVLLSVKQITVLFNSSSVYETGLLLVCACRTSAASVEPLPRGSRAVAFPRWLHVLSCSTWLIVRCFGCINSCVLSFCFISTNSKVLIPSAERRPQVVEALLMLPSARRYFCCATLIMIW